MSNSNWSLPLIWFVWRYETVENRFSWSPLVKPYELIFRKSNLLDWNDLLSWISWTWFWGRVCPAWWKWSHKWNESVWVVPSQSQFDLIPGKSSLLDWNGRILWFSLTWSLGRVCQFALLDPNDLILWISLAWSWGKFWPVRSNWSHPASLTWSLWRVKFAGSNWAHLVDWFDLILRQLTC